MSNIDRAGRGTFIPKYPFQSALKDRSRIRPANAETKMILQASSPDEVALVKYSNSLGMELIERDKKHVQLRNPKMIYENYEILAEFPFSSSSKKMSVLVRHVESGKIIYYVKGAEIVMESMMKQQQKGILLELCEQLAREGLRTLVFGQKELTKTEFDRFNTQYQRAMTSMQDRENHINQALKLIEFDLVFIGITGVEDKL